MDDERTGRLAAPVIRDIGRSLSKNIDPTTQRTQQRPRDPAVP
jgi:hypothetical protein